MLSRIDEDKWEGKKKTELDLSKIGRDAKRALIGAAEGLSDIGAYTAKAVENAAAGAFDAAEEL